VRAGAAGLCTAISRLGAIATVIALPSLIQTTGLSAALWLFVAAGAVGLVFCLILAPETKGQTLEEISEAEQTSPLVAKTAS
jgi:MFS transporter, putative metabolite transport protein